MADTAKQKSQAELKVMKRRCWSTGCKNRAWLIDWTGYRLCLSHWWRSYRWGGGEVSIRSFWWNLCVTKVY